MPIVTVYHNNHPAQARHRGYDTSDTVTVVFRYYFGDAGDNNCDDDNEMLDGEISELFGPTDLVDTFDGHRDTDDDDANDDADDDSDYLIAYRARNNRPGATGDVVRIEHPAHSTRADPVITYYARTSSGWEEVGEPTISNRRVPGTTPYTVTGLELLMADPRLRWGDEPGLVTIDTGNHTITMFAQRTIAYVTDNSTGDMLANCDGDVSTVAEHVLFWNAKYTHWHQ